MAKEHNPHFQEFEIGDESITRECFTVKEYRDGLLTNEQTYDRIGKAQRAFADSKKMLKLKYKK